MHHLTRVIHLTFPKCGSQWVRDVLTAPEIVPYSGVMLHPTDLPPIASSWPEQPLNTFMGPIYNATYADWETHRINGDKAVVVLRDPRDLLVSFIHSVAFSHVPILELNLIRETLLTLDTRTKVLWGIATLVNMCELLRSWAKRETTASEYVTSYERLVENPMSEFTRILEFLGWTVPESVLAGVTHRLSFTERSGRAPGTEDVFSHYRKGQPGDWRRFFDQGLGQFWESLQPGTLCALGYEKDDQWYKDLECADPSARPYDVAQLKQTVELQAEMTRLREENSELRKGLAALQSHVTGLEGRLSPSTEQQLPTDAP